MVHAKQYSKNVFAQRSTFLYFPQTHNKLAPSFLSARLRWGMGTQGKWENSKHVPTLVGLSDWATTPQSHRLQLVQCRVPKGTCCSFLQWDVEILLLSDSKHCLPLISGLFLDFLWSYISPKFTKGGVGSDGYERGLVWSNKWGRGRDFLNGRLKKEIKKRSWQKTLWEIEAGQPCGIMAPSSPSYKSQPQEWEHG